jgi:predicted aspartyl protease
MIFDHDAELVELPSIQFGPICVESLKVMVMDLSDVAQRFGIQADAIVGMDILRRSSFAIDYKSKQVSFGAEES